ASTPSRSKTTARITLHRPGLEEVVDLPPLPVALVVRRDALGRGLDAAGPRHRRDRLGERRVEPGADGGEDRRAEARALGPVGDAERDPERVGEDGRERRALAETAAHRQVRNVPAAHRAELLAVAADRIGDVLD